MTSTPEKKILLEVACFDIQSAIVAARAGADRIELCDNHHEGGTTPAPGTFKWLRKKIDIPVFCMIRARGGDFLYSEEELAAMRYDLQWHKNAGCDGVVLGFLTSDGAVDKNLTSRFVEWAYPLDVTFHRAFDRASDPVKALEDIVACGCQRILTSGQQPRAEDGISLLQKLIIQADDRIIVMPGSGIRSHNAKSIIEQTGASEIHTAAWHMHPSNMRYTNAAMNEKLDIMLTDEAEIAQIRAQLK